VKLLICGSRDWSPTIDEIDRELRLGFPSDVIFTEVVSGKANGADRAGEDWAQSRGISIKPFPADWKRYNRAAGAIRNAAMADYTDVALAFLKNRSRGTSDMIAKLGARQKYTWVVEWGAVSRQLSLL